jgi:hypothetical protein
MILVNSDSISKKLPWPADCAHHRRAPAAATAGSTRLTHLELHCPALTSRIVPPLPPKPVAARPAHAPVAAMLRDNARDAAAAAAEARQAQWKAPRGDSAIPAVHRPVAA